MSKRRGAGSVFAVLLTAAGSSQVAAAAGETELEERLYTKMVNQFDEELFQISKTWVSYMAPHVNFLMASIDARLDATDAGFDHLANALGGGGKVKIDPSTTSNTNFELPVFGITQVDSAGNIHAIPGSSNSVAGAVDGLGESIKNTANAAVKYDNPGSKAQLTLNPGGEATRLANVQAGALTADSTDAVNGSQLSSSNGRIGQLDAQFSELATRTGNDIAAARAHTDSNVVAVRESIQAVEGVAADAARTAGKVGAEVAELRKGVGKAYQTDAKSTLSKPQASGSDAVAGGGGARAVGEGSVAMGAQAHAEGSKASAVGRGAVAVADNSVALGAGSVAERNNTVAVGHAGSERQITHVAAGTRGTDAVSVSQLAGATASATQQAHAYTDQRFAQIHHDLKEQDNTLSAGIAGAMAMASLPRSLVAGSSMTSVAMGNYRGESALAVGVSYVSNSGRWSGNFMGTTNTRNDAGAAVGVGYQW
ncbi:YadA family autotransporter adhesin [Pseudomonas sp. WC1]|uniref:YadA family autotransporter adhesin n=1 Tax=Pseudomonas sp. WC1 TaxID=3424772 RepID=UPI003D34D15E